MPDIPLTFTVDRVTPRGRPQPHIWKISFRLNGELIYQQYRHAAGEADARAQARPTWDRFIGHLKENPQWRPASPPRQPPTPESTPTPPTK